MPTIIWIPNFEPSGCHRSTMPKYLLSHWIHHVPYQADFITALAFNVTAISKAAPTPKRTLLLWLTDNSFQLAILVMNYTAICSVFSDCIFQHLFNHTHKPLTINKVWCLYIKYLIQIADPKAEPVLVLENSWLWKRWKQMVIKAFSPEQIINKLREAEVLLGQGLTVDKCHWEFEIQG